MDFLRENFGIIIIGLSLFHHFRRFTQYKDNVEFKKHFYISSIIGVILLGLVVIYRFTTIINLNTIVILLLIGSISLIPFEWPLWKKYRNDK